MASLPDIAAHEQLQHFETGIFKKSSACCFSHIIEEAAIFHPFGFPGLVDFFIPDIFFTDLYLIQFEVMLFDSVATDIDAVFTNARFQRGMVLGTTLSLFIVMIEILIHKLRLYKLCYRALRICGTRHVKLSGFSFLQLHWTSAFFAPDLAFYAPGLYPM